ncbi:MAG: HlyD family efflux transporter periplasmic adaptor subunit [Rikenellaceae bacterium]
MPENSNNIDHNNETTDILGKMPSWMIRWGLTIIFVIFIGLVLGSYFIKLPQTISVPITITSLHAPADLNAAIYGSIDTVLVVDGECVEENQIIAILHSNSSYLDIMCVRDRLDSFRVDNKNSWLDVNYQIYDLQPDFSDFKTDLLNYNNYIKANNIRKKIDLKNIQIANYENHIAHCKAQQLILEESLECDMSKFRQDSIDCLRGGVAVDQYVQARQLIIYNRCAIEQLKNTIIEYEISMLQVQEQLIDLNILLDNEIDFLINEIKATRLKLLDKIEQWQQNYLLTSPSKGVLSYCRHYGVNQNVIATEKIGTIAPLKNSVIMGIMEIPAYDIGKVIISQTVNVKLDGYPYNEYGAIKGNINRISSVPSNEDYVVEVSFPDGLKSTYNKDIEFVQYMKGGAEIITKDERLIFKFIAPLRSLFDKIDKTKHLQ